MPSLCRPDREDRPATGDPCGQWLVAWSHWGAQGERRFGRCSWTAPTRAQRQRHPGREAGPQSQGSLADRPAAEKEMLLPDPRRIRSGISTVVRRRARGNRVGIALLVLSAVTLVGVMGEYVASGDTQLLLANGGWTASALAAVIGVTAATRRSARPDRAGWALLLCGCVAWLVGKLLWNAYSATSFPPSPNPADICRWRSRLADTPLREFTSDATGILGGYSISRCTWSSSPLHSASTAPKSSQTFPNTSAR